MAIVIKTEAGYLMRGTSEFTWRRYLAFRFPSVAQALEVRKLLNVKQATVIKTPPRRKPSTYFGIDIFPDDNEVF